MAADDFLNHPLDQGLPAGLDGTGHTGNRPASGARHATPGEVLSQSFQGAQNAGDFLGLDTEFTAHQDPSQGYGGLDLVQPPGTYPQDAAGYVPEPAPLPEGDAVQDFAQAPSAFEFGEDLGSEEALLGETEEPARGKTPLLVGALLLVGVVAGGVVYGPDLYSRYLGGSATEVASTDEPGWKEKPTRPQPAAAVEPSSTGASSAPAGTTPDVVPPSGAAPTSSGTPPTSVASTPTTVPSQPAQKPRVTPEKAPEGVASSATPPVQAGPATPSLTVPPPRKVEFPDLAGSTYQWASEDQLELIWRGSEVPMEAVHAPAKTLMPRVGHVRVFTLGGDVFAGRLYAVGQGLVWIDGEPGRIGLDGSKVERIEVLPPDPTGTELADGSGELGGRRVRVKVPGGMLYGSVLKADGEDVMLALETGGRVRVKASDVQDLGSGRAVVVRQ